MACRHFLYDTSELLLGLVGDSTGRSPQLVDAFFHNIFIVLRKISAERKKYQEKDL